MVFVKFVFSTYARQLQELFKMCFFPEAYWEAGPLPDRAGHEAAARSSGALVGWQDAAFPCSPPAGLEKLPSSWHQQPECLGLNDTKGNIC